MIFNKQNKVVSCAKHRRSKAFHLMLSRLMEFTTNTHPLHIKPPKPTLNSPSQLLRLLRFPLLIPNNALPPKQIPPRKPPPLPRRTRTPHTTRPSMLRRHRCAWFGFRVCVVLFRAGCEDEFIGWRGVGGDLGPGVYDGGTAACERISVCGRGG